MTRKDTILIAVLINTGLLVFLFVGALKPAPLLEDVKELVKDDIPLPTQGRVDPVDHLVKNTVRESSVVAKPSGREDAKPVVKPIMTQPTTAIKESIQSENTRDRSEEKKLIEVVVKQGDVLEKIARRYNCKVEEIIQVNHLPSTRLQIGQILYVPSIGVMISGEGRTTSNEQFYIVKNGDNPWSIAIKNGIKFNELLRLNQLDEEKAKKLKPGDKLRIR